MHLEFRVSISVNMIIFVSYVAKSFKYFLEKPESKEAELVTITLGLFSSSSASNYSRLLRHLTFLKAKGLSSISWKLPLKFIQSRCDLATSKVSLLMCSR